MEDKIDKALDVIKKEYSLAHWPGGAKSNSDSATLKADFYKYTNEASK